MHKKQTKVPNKKTDSARYTVIEEAELLSFLLDKMAGAGRNAVKSILTRGQVTVDGKIVKQYNQMLQSGQVVNIVKNQVAIKENALEGISILHEDEDIIVINKDAGVLSVASKNESEMTAYRQIRDYVSQGNPTKRIFIVHRLDKDTSGVMLFAKSEEVKEKLQSNWSTIVKERVYIALVEGAVRKKAGKIASWLKESKTYKVYSNPTDNGGQYAITHYKTIQVNKQFSLLEVELETGRKNQIRVHLEELGHPIVGDKRYGATGNPIKRLGLHATRIVLIHPRTDKLMRFETDAPKSFYTKLK